MTYDPRLDLVAELPAGEWADVQVLNQPPGMMADRNWAVLAKARWLRRGGRSAFIKFIIPAGRQAGTVTRLVTGGERLQRLCERLQAIASVSNKVPLVPLLEVRLTTRGLLIAMEEVTPLHDIIERGEGYDYSLRLLRDLDPESESEGHLAWLHFDICPSNVGVLSDGRCVLIDVESFYLEEKLRYDVSVPAWKSFRAPQFLVEEVESKLAVGHTDRSLAVKKVGFEVALAAAECVLGPLPPIRGEEFTEELLELWVETADSADPAVEFWYRELQNLIRTEQVPSVRDIAQRLDIVLQQGRELVHAPRVTVAALRTQRESVAEVSANEISVEPSQDVPAGWETDWLMLKSSAHALRAGRFDRVRIAEYRLALERLARQYPTRREIWDELLLVAISYQKDPVAALVIVGNAVGHFPNDIEFERQRNIIQKWATERQNENNAG